MIWWGPESERPQSSNSKALPPDQRRDSTRRQLFLRDSAPSCTSAVRNLWTYMPRETSVYTPFSRSAEGFHIVGKIGGVRIGIPVTRAHAKDLDDRN